VTGRLRRHAFGAAVLVLLLGIAAVGSFLVAVAAPDLAALAAGGTIGASPAPSATPLSPMALSPVGIELPEGADCAGCHTDDGVVGTKPIPVMGHPLWGWRDCTACHSTGSLVRSAPGHSGIHQDQCLLCHQSRSDAGESPPPLRPEHMGTDKPCTACHGVDEHAPLPPSMAGRGDRCWICHNGPEYRYLFEEEPSASAEPAT
jgi:hypothetical protein